MERKSENCRFVLVKNRTEYWCAVNGLNDCKTVSSEQCERCRQYCSRYMQFPITVTSVTVKEAKPTTLYVDKIGRFVSVRPCEKQYENKTYIGLMLGELAQTSSVRYDEKSGEMIMEPWMAPAVFVPELKKVFFGNECWWSILDENQVQEQINPITDEVINKQWYIQLLNATQMANNNKTSNSILDETADEEDDERPVSATPGISQELIDFAKRLHRMDWMSSKFPTQEAKQKGYVIAYGFSDDLLEFEGAFANEFGAWDGTTIAFNENGECCGEQDDPDCSFQYHWFVHAVWSPKYSAYSWEIKTNIPHAEFELLDDGKPFCRAIVFDIKNIQQEKN